MTEMKNKRNAEAGLDMEQSLTDAPWPVAARSLMSEREKSLYQDLISLYPDHKIFVQVALSQLVDVARNHPNRMAIRGRFKQLVADFVLCRPDLTIVAVIELDDRTHLWADRKRADARKSKALADAGLRLVRIPAGAIPPLGKLKELIESGRATVASSIGDIELKLAESASTFDYSDEIQSVSPFGGGMSRQMKRALWKISISIIFVAFMVVACFVYIPYVIQRAFGSLAPRSAAPHDTPAQFGTPMVGPRIAGGGPPAGAGAGAAVEHRSDGPMGQAEVVELKKQKAREWAAFYSAPSSCEHPASWSDQVECGNQYMRAKKRFEQQWAAAHPGDLAHAPVVLDNDAIRNSAASPSRKPGS
jgi:very-short-patch-repair endonuclease